MVAQIEKENGEKKNQQEPAIKGESHTLPPAFTENQMVGAVRFELTTSCTRNKRATRLRYAPTLSEKHNGVDRAFAILKFAL